MNSHTQQNSIKVCGHKLYFMGKEYFCSYGRNGFCVNKIEGDGCTPVGNFRILGGFYRYDKIGSLTSLLPLVVTSPEMGWCDDPESAEYNNLISKPYDKNHEDLYRHDDRYDIVLYIDHNMNPVVSGKGSAIFIHVASFGYGPTEGCIGLSLQDLKEIVTHINKDTIISLNP